MNPLPVPRRLTDFSADAVALAPRLLGKFLCRRLADGTLLRRRITETEAYFGEGTRPAMRTRDGRPGRTSCTRRAAAPRRAGAFVIRENCCSH